MAQGEPEPNCPSLRAIGKNCYPVPTTSDRSFEPCGVQRQVQLRYSKQPGRSSALRSISNNAKARPIVGLSERVYESTKLAALFRHARRPGLAGRRNTENVNLPVEEVHSPKSRISLAELIPTASAISSFCEPCRACCQRRRAVRVAREPNGVAAGRPEGGRECSCGSADLDRQPNLALSNAAAPGVFQPAVATIGLAFAGALSAFFDQDR
jgi:hypothetical protein